MPSKLQIVGIYRKRVRRLVRCGSPKAIEMDRPYVILSYSGQEMGRLAISDAVYEMMRADGARVLLNGGA